MATSNISLVSGNTGLLGNASSKSKSISDGGRYVVFESDATNLVAGDTNGVTDIFIKDILTGTITRVSTDASGVQGNAGTWGADISADGRYVQLVSAATNLVTGDTNGVDDVFIKDTQTGAITRVNTTAAGEQATGGTWGSDTYDISADGRYVVIGSDATNLVAGDTNGAWDIFLKDTQTGAITRVNTDATGAQANAGADFMGGKVTDDGRYVVFASNASNLVAGDTNGISDIFKKDLQTGAITRVSVGPAGQEIMNVNNIVEDLANGVQINNLAGISADGRYVAIQSSGSTEAGTTIPGVFLKDTLTGAIIEVSTDAAGVWTNATVSATNRALSADGRFVVFNSTASNLVAGDTGGKNDVFIKDTQTGQIARLSVDAAGVQGNGGSNGARISPDGSTITFNTNATNLVSGDVNGVQDAVSVANPFFILTGNGGTAPLNIAAGIVTLVDVVPGTDIINISSGATAVQSLTVATASYAANTTNSGILVVNALPTTASTITGSSGNDIITGSSTDDNLAGGVGNDILNGSAGNDVMEGGAGNDTYYVDSSNDSVVETGSVSGSTTLGFRLALDLSSNIDKVIASISYTLGNSLENLDLAAGSGNINGAGNALDNVLAGNEGNNYLDGGAGTDTAVYPAAHASYTIAKTSTGYTVSGVTDGSDALTNIERLSFTGKRIAIDLDGNAGTAAKLLGAVFGATSVDNPAYVGICLSIVDGGISYPDLMAAALNFAGATTSNTVVTLLWTNLVGAAPTVAQAAPIAALIDNGSYSAAALGILVADSSFNATNIDLVGLATTGIEFI